MPRKVPKPLTNKNRATENRKNYLRARYASRSNLFRPVMRFTKSSYNGFCTSITKDRRKESDRERCKEKEKIAKEKPSNKATATVSPTAILLYTPCMDIRTWTSEFGKDWTIEGAHSRDKNKKSTMKHR